MYDSLWENIRSIQLSELRAVCRFSRSRDSKRWTYILDIMQRRDENARRRDVAYSPKRKRGREEERAKPLRNTEVHYYKVVSRGGSSDTAYTSALLQRNSSRADVSALCTFYGSYYMREKAARRW